MKRPSLPMVAACAALAGALALWAWTARSRAGDRPATAAAPTAAAAAPTGRPSAPPGPDGPHPTIAEPTMPPLTPAWRRTVTAQVAADPRPGAAAFRAMADLYVDHNADFARAQAEAEGITVPEVRELTHLGLLVLATQRVAEVEDVLGHDLDDAARAELTALMHASNDDFKRDLRALVAADRPEDERWQLIRATLARYLDRFTAIAGLDPDQLDALLGGNVLLPGAPIAGPPTPSPTDPADHHDSPAEPPRPPRP